MPKCQVRIHTINHASFPYILFINLEILPNLGAMSLLFVVDALWRRFLQFIQTSL